MTDQAPLRRTPRQARSQKRVDAILQAAASLLNERGFEAMTTSAIAERAGVPVGTLYQFFPNRDAVLAGLALQYLDDMEADSAQLFTPDIVYVPLPVLMERTIDWIVAFGETHPGFFNVVGGAWVSPELHTASDRFFSQLAGNIGRIITAHAPQLAQERMQVASLILMKLVGTVMPVIESAPAQARAQVIADFKRICLLYLKSVCEEA